MTTLQSSLSGDQFVLWSINLLVQVTLISLATLLAARCGRRSPAVKWSILCAGLMLVLLSPAIVLLSQARGIGIVSVPLGRQAAPARTDAVGAPVAVSAADMTQAESARRASDFRATPEREDDRVASTATPMPSRFDVAGTEDGLAAAHGAVTATFPTDAASIVRWLFACVLVTWCGGTVLLLIRLLRAWWMLEAIRRAAPTISARRVDAVLRGVCDDLRLCRAPHVTASTRVGSPMAVGIWRPQVILPEGLLNQLGDAELRSVLTHEVAHIARRDLVVVLGQNLAVSLFWLHPLVHILNRQLALAREEVCDNHVLKTIGAPAYSRVLLRLAELIQVQDRLLASVSLLPREWNLEARVAGILSEGRSTVTRLTQRSRLLVLTLTVSIAVIAAHATLTFSDGAERDAASAAPPAAPTTAAAQEADPEQPPDAPQGTRFQFEGQVVTPDGHPVAGARIYIAQRGARPLATTDAQGRFQFTRTKPQLPNRAQWGVNRLVAVADGYGPAWLKAIIFDVSGNARRDWESRNPNSRFPKVWEQTERVLTLVEDDVPIQGRIVDLEGRPAAGVAIQPRFIDDLYARFAFHEVTTNARGEFEVRGVGRNRTVRLVAKGDHIAFSVFFARTEHGPTLTKPSRPVEEEPEFPGDTRNVRVVYSATPVHAVAPSVPVEGTVTDVDTGLPISGVTIYAYGLDNNPEVGRREEFNVTTDDRGWYRMTGLPIGFNELLAIGDGTRPYLPGGVAVQTNDQQSVHTRDFKLKCGLWLEGRVTDGASGGPVRATIDCYAVSENPSANRTQDFEESLDGNHCQTDGSGRYRLPILPGPAIVTINASDPRAYPTGIMSDKLAAEYAGGSIPLGSTRALLFPLGFNFLASIDPEEATERETLDVHLRTAPGVTVRFVDPDGQPLSGVSVTDYTQSHGLTIDASTVLNGNVYAARNYLPAQPRRLVAWHPERNLAGQQVIRELPAGDLTFVLRPAATIKGRIVDDDGQPRPARFYRSLTNAPTALEAGVLTGTGDVLSTNADGTFEFRWLVPGVTYRVTAVHPTEGQLLGLLLDNVQLEAGEVRDLGDVRIQRETP